MKIMAIPKEYEAMQFKGLTEVLSYHKPCETVLETKNERVKQKIEEIKSIEIECKQRTLDLFERIKDDVLDHVIAGIDTSVEDGGMQELSNQNIIEIAKGKLVEGSEIRNSDGTNFKA